MTTTRSERRFSPLIVGGGAAVALALVAILLFGRGAEEPPAAVPAPPPAPASPAISPAATPQPTPPVSLDGLRLHGVAGAGAIIGTGDGIQHLVPIGRDVRPGLVLASVGGDHAVLRAGATTYRLGFDGVTATGAGPAAAPATDGTAALREEALRYHLAFAPVTTGGRVTGHVVRAGASVPALARAGIRPGDVIRSVNGTEFDAERREELAWTLANTDQTTFEIVRDGRPVRLSTGR